MINLADVAAASNGLYDNVVAVSSAQPVVATVMLVSMGLVVCTAWVCSSVRSSRYVVNAVCKFTFVLSAVVTVFSFVLVVCQSVVLKSGPSVMDVVEVCYEVEALSADDTSDVVVHFFADYGAVSDTSSTATFNNDGQVLNAVVVVVDNSLNVYVINTDTDQIVQPAVSNSSEIARLLEEKFQS